MVLKVGHRGAPKQEPENTLVSFMKAVKLGADMVELDVHLCKSGELIVMHDETLDRTTNGKGRIKDKDYSEIKELRTKERKQKISTLDDIFKIMKGMVRFDVEIKDTAAANAVIKLIRKHKMEKDVIVSSNYPEALLTVKKKLSKVETALIYWAAKTMWGERFFVLFSLLAFPFTKKRILSFAKKADAKYVFMFHMFATKSFVRHLQKKGFKVGVWVVNEKKRIEEMKNKNVDVIISDYIDKL